MPWRSRAQQRYMHAAAARGDVPKKVVADFDAATPHKSYAHLPEHVQMARGGSIMKCPHCGESFHGYAEGGEVDEHTEPMEPRKKGYGMSGGIHWTSEPDDVRIEPIDPRKKGHGMSGGIHRYADGGEIEDSVLGRKKEHDLPELELNVYRGEGVPRRDEAEKDEDEDEDTALASSRRYSDGGIAEHLAKRNAARRFRAR